MENELMLIGLCLIVFILYGIPIIMGIITLPLTYLNPNLSYHNDWVIYKKYYKTHKLNFKGREINHSWLILENKISGKTWHRNNAFQNRYFSNKKTKQILSDNTKWKSIIQ